MRSLFVVTTVLAILALGEAAVGQSSISSVRDYELLDEYVAYIGPDDLYNSQGERLRHPWQIVRQDRANYHLFGFRDDLDEGDHFFFDADNRAAMEDMLRRGSISRAAAQDILAGGILIFVEIYGRGNRGYAVIVTTDW